MIQKTPRIDDRSGEQIFQALAQELQDHLAIDADGKDPLAEAMLRVFSRYCELIIERLNKVPDKHHDAFLDILNISRIPPFPASAALTFKPVKLPPKDAPFYVPAFTKVAAPPGEGESEPVVFETARDLALTNADLIKIVAFDPAVDLYEDKSLLATGEGATVRSVFGVGQPVAHEFYLGHDPVFGRPGISELRLHFEVAGRAFRRCGLQWWIPAKDGDQILTPVEDTTEQLSQSGDVVFRNLPEWPPHEIFGRKTRWIGCRMLDRLPMGNTAKKGLPVRLPRIGKVAVSAAWEMKEGAVDAAFFNNMPLDLSKDFFPFGASPRFGDVLYLKCDAFSVPKSRVSLKIKLTNPASAGEDAPIPAVSKMGEPGIQWECWDGRRWVPLAHKDGTDALTENGEVSLQVPPTAPQATVNGVAGCWMRARLVSGGYGDGSAGTGAPIPAPPSIQSIAVLSSSEAGPEEPVSIVSNNNLAFERVSSFPFSPFQAASAPQRALYLGIRAPVDGRNAFGKKQLDIYVRLDKPGKRAFIRTDSVGKSPTLSWQYWNGRAWTQARTEDDTASLTTSGIITVYTGDDIAPWREFSPEQGIYSLDRGLLWLRVLWTSGEYESPPLLRRILLNTVPATQTSTIENELMGSSTGRQNQVFYTARVPVLHDLRHNARAPILHELRLEVREPDMPPAAELMKIRKEEGDDVLTFNRDPRGKIEQIWVRWHKVDDFLSSSNSDRHFVVEHEAGEIRFGDGSKGLIPPPGANNIRLRRYRTGGGTAGNKPSGAISQLRATVPYVDSVANLDPAFGGQDIEEWNSMRERGSRSLRHRGRAVTMEDYEDLARIASSAIAKSKCYPNRDLAADPAGKLPIPGIVSIIIVPAGNEPAPLPDPALLRCVRDFLNERKAPDAGIVLLAPEYVKVSLDIVVVPAVVHTGAGIVMQCEKVLNEFLHPITGGPDGQGWDFGRLPRESDFYALLESMRGLDFIRSLKVRLIEERPGLLESGIFLIRPGEHSILSGM